MAWEALSARASPRVDRGSGTRWRLKLPNSAGTIVEADHSSWDVICPFPENTFKIHESEFIKRGGFPTYFPCLSWDRLCQMILRFGKQGLSSLVAMGDISDARGFLRS